MKVLVIFAHPVETSFNAALHGIVIDELKKAGHEVDDCDLYAEGFDPVLTRDERINYQDTDKNIVPVRSYAERLRWADALVLCFPVWNYGFPAILKGFLDRVFLPGVSFTLVNDTWSPSLHNIRKVVAVTTYGGNRFRAILMGDPPRRLVTRMLRMTIRPRAEVAYLAQYDINKSSEAARETFKAKVAERMRAF